jgi:hypothetical protein
MHEYTADVGCSRMEDYKMLKSWQDYNTRSMRWFFIWYALFIKQTKNVYVHVICPFVTYYQH